MTLNITSGMPRSGDLFLFNTKDLYSCCSILANDMTLTKPIRKLKDI